MLLHEQKSTWYTKGCIEDSFIQIHPLGLQSHELEFKFEADGTGLDGPKNISNPYEIRKGDGEFSQNPRIHTKYD